MVLLPTFLLFSASALPQDPPKTKEPWTQAELERISDEIRGQIEELRGMKFTRPVAAKITDKKGFLSYAKKRQEAMESPERRQRDETVAKMLGLVPFDMDLGKTLDGFLEQQVGGFYDPGTNTFYLMEQFEGDLARIILAHELTHALDDQCFGLDKLVEGAAQETDAEFAIQAMAEGSGTNAMTVWTLKHMHELDPSALGSEDLETKGLDTAPTYIWKPLLAAYLRGDGFLAHAEGMNMFATPAKTEELKRCFADPPRSSEQILHPKKYWDPKKRDDPKPVTLDSSGLPKDWKVIGQDTLGELYLALLTQPFSERGGLDASNKLAILGVQFTNKAAEGWGGDRLLLAAKGDARVLYLDTLWDTPEDATEFHDVLAKLVQRDETPAQKLVSGPEQQRLSWLQGLSDLALVKDTEHSAVTLRIEWKTKKGAEGLPPMLPWALKK